MVAQRTVSGTVTEQSSGDPLPGVSIQIKGTNQGTTTDFDGKYMIDTVKDGSVLEFSYMGYTTQTIAVTSSTINVALLESAEALDEVVVIGYGTSKKEDLTGSVNKVTTKDFNKGAVSNPQQLITGKIAGVTVTSGGGAPGEGGSITIRGISSLSLTNDPLIVVDGIPLDNKGIGGARNTLNLVNPSDIESMVVLKDASATAIYGSRAANGVIIITTKKGKDKGFSFNYGTKASFYHPYQTVDMMTADEFREVVVATGDAVAIARLGNSDTDWQKEIYRDAAGLEHNISGTGNVFGVPMRASIGHTNQDGILKTDNFKRTTASLNLKPSLLDEHLKIDLNTRLMYTENFFANKGAIGAAIVFDPTQAIYDSTSPFDGYFSWIDPATDPILQYDLATTNPVAQLNLRKDFSFVNRFVGNVKFDYKLHFFPALTASLNLGLDNSKSNGRTITSELMPTDQSVWYDWNGLSDRYEQERKNKLLDAYFTYSKESDKHNFKFMGGYSYQYFFRDNYRYDDEDFKRGLEKYEYLDPEEELLLSYYGRLNYKFNDKYLLTATLRADASSKLNPDDRWGYFPSVALAWNIHKENFLINSKFNELKLRLGYGEVGNVNGLEPYLFLTSYTGSTGTAAYQLGNQFYQTYRPKPENQNIRWEVGKTTNIGLDFSMYDRRLSGSINAYQKETKDLIIKSIVDPFTNFGNKVDTNVGDMVNKGIEVELNGGIVRTDDISWNVSYNVSFNDNEVTYMPFVQDVGGVEGGVGNNIQIHTEGQSPYSFNVYEQVYDSEGRPIEGVYVDRNDDGIINNEDKYFYKDPLADIQMGLSSTLKVKNFDLSITSRANIGNYMYDNVASSKAIPRDLTTLPFSNNLHSDYFNTGFQTHLETSLLSDHYVTDASFIKIDNITMGLNFPDFWKDADIRVFATVQNVATFTEYTGLDPEVNFGIDNNFYPRPRTFTFGFDFDF
jgi:iron complex outermembrane receptor protein